MTELERDLRELGRALELPRTPELAPAVRARLEAGPPHWRLPARRTLVLAFALAAVAIGATLAVPQARTAILEWLGLRGVAIERTEGEPTATGGLEDRDALDLGERVTLAEARRAVDYRLGVPSDRRLGEPEEIYVAAGGRVSFVYVDDKGGIEALVTQFRARLEEDFVRKAIGPGTTVEPARVAGSPGWWIEGEPHEIVLVRDGEPLFETLRLATNTLLWERDGVTLRLEGEFEQADALEIASTFRR